MQEFQGKPIFARIKAKPMNRLLVPNVGGVKNGFRATPPTAVYDPASFPPGQQRFIYANGTPGQPVTYSNQVHVYVSTLTKFFPMKFAAHILRGGRLVVILSKQV